MEKFSMHSLFYYHKKKSIQWFLIKNSVQSPLILTHLRCSSMSFMILWFLGISMELII